jgi:hypothetical protein
VVAGVAVTGADGEAVFAGAVVVTVTDGLGEGDTMAVGDALAVGDTMAVGPSGEEPGAGGKRALDLELTELPSACSATRRVIEAVQLGRNSLDSNNRLI